MECLGNDGELAQLGKRFDAGDDRYGDTHSAGFLYELEVFLVVVEELGDSIVGTQVLFLFQIHHVHFEIWGLVVLFGIASHTEVEFLTGAFDGSAVGEESLVEAVHLANQVGGMLVSSGSGDKPAVLLRLVATQQQEVGYAQELQVEQFIFDVLHSGAAAYHVRLHGYAVFVLYSRCYGYGAGAAAHPVALQQSVVELFIHKLAVVGCDINKQGVEFLHLLDSGEQFVRARSFQWGQYLEGEMLVSLAVVQ